MYPKTKNSKSFPILPENINCARLPQNIIELMPRNLIQDLQAFVFASENDKLKIAAVNPLLDSVQRFVRERFGSDAEIFSATPENLKTVLDAYRKDYRAEIVRLAGSGAVVNGNNTEIVDDIIEFAVSKKASDIHVEPAKNETDIRFRVDGILQSAAKLPRAIHEAIIARFKILANLKIDEYRNPQDGRIELPQFPDISLRVSTVPTIYGEKIALRILEEGNKSLTLVDLGFTDSQAEILIRNTEKPFGMIVTSGPTGSGKTTTLYGLLSMLKKSDINISTLEDPVEYALAGINQIHINPRVNLTFASGLRALLRQDPDVIMVGEIRDSETAVMASNAALTGHLVLTTMHTNDAPSVCTRLLEMKVEDFSVASIVNLIIAQRLVRKVCNSCAKRKKLSEPVIKKIKERGDIVSSLKAINVKVDDLAKTEFRYGEGCDNCFMTGYSGRVGMFELLELNDEIRGLVLSHAPAEQIKAAAVKAGFKEMVLDGLRKAYAGMTTFEEVLKATRNA